MKRVYAITGRAGAGKDTTANMLRFLYRRYIVDGESFYTYVNELGNNNKVIFHFADTLKVVISVLFNIPLFKLNSRKFKDEMFFNLNTYEFTEGKNIKITDNIFSIDKLQEFGLRKLIDVCNVLGYQPYIKLRTLLQWIGTEICRNQINDHIWTNNTISKITEMLKNVDTVFIADMRFKEELDSLTKYCADNSIQLITININRPNGLSVEQNHISENNTLKCDYVIENDGTLEDLFEKVKDIYHENY